jgi:hypothetical protein
MLLFEQIDDMKPAFPQIEVDVSHFEIRCAQLHASARDSAPRWHSRVTFLCLAVDTFLYIKQGTLMFLGLFVKEENGSAHALSLDDGL